MTDTAIRPEQVQAKMGETKLGEARCPGLSFEDLARADTRPVPEFLETENYEYMGSGPIATERYTSRAFFDLEIKRLWPKVWQFAARDEEMPDPGDFVVYENAGRSYLVTRQADGSVRAFYNTCLHRGRLLRTESGTAEQFRCPFHGFTWNTDGTLKHIPCRWDFPHLMDETMSLPEAKVAQWGGYIFVREAAEGPSIEEFLAPLPKIFERWDHSDKVTTFWVGKVINANWKTTYEAFIESWHVVETHKQLMPFTGDANTRYDVFGDHVNLALTPFATPSPHLDESMTTPRWIADRLVDYNSRPGHPAHDIDVPAGQTARIAVAELHRKFFNEQDGYDYSEASDSEMLDAFVYNVFPNFSPWGGHIPNIVYRWRPWPDETKTLMEVRFLTRFKRGEKRPRSVPMRFLGPDESFGSVADMGPLGPVLDQDMTNMPVVQEGMKYAKTRLMQLGNYQEIRVRHFNRTLDKYLAGS